jgi:murein DD-endopeptidase MepM/ murein hydrolase activator NlpD
MSCLGEKYPGRVWLRGAAFALIAVGSAGCSSEATRFSEFSNPFANPFAARSAEAPAAAGQVESRPIAQAPLPPPGKPVAAAPITRPVASTSSAKHVHVVARGDTLMKISRQYGKPVAEIAKANKISAQSKLEVGARITVPGGRPVATVAAAPAPEPEPKPAAKPKVAALDPPHTARIASPEPVAPESSTKAAEAAGSLPSFRWPVRGRVIAGFGPKTNGQQNDGINLAVPEGTPIKAAEDGVVAYAGNELKGYGNLVLIRHGNGFVSAYAHASEVLAKRGDQIKRGQVIARSGQTGNVTSPQLHFEIRKGATPVDPTQFLTSN